MKRIAIFVTLFTFGGLAISSFAQNRNDLKPIETPRIRVDDIMHAKLQSSQELLKALALEDFKSIEKQAQRLELLGLDTDWNIVQTKDYTRLSGEFREAAKKMRKAGEAKNLDRAGLGFMQLTMSCIDCHGLVRASKK